MSIKTLTDKQPAYYTTTTYNPQTNEQVSGSEDSEDRVDSAFATFAIEKNSKPLTKSQVEAYRRRFEPKRFKMMLSDGTKVTSLGKVRKIEQGREPKLTREADDSYDSAPNWESESEKWRPEGFLGEVRHVKFKTVEHRKFENRFEEVREPVEDDYCIQLTTPEGKPLFLNPDDLTKVLPESRSDVTERLYTKEDCDREERQLRAALTSQTDPGPKTTRS